MNYELSIATNGELMATLWPSMIDYLKGRNKELLDHITEICKKRGLLESFASSIILDDLDVMKWFYERCSHRNDQICRHLNLESPLIPQEKLDDWLIEWAFAQK